MNFTYQEAVDNTDFFDLNTYPPPPNPDPSTADEAVRTYPFTQLGTGGNATLTDDNGIPIDPSLTGFGQQIAHNDPSWNVPNQQPEHHVQRAPFAPMTEEEVGRGDRPFELAQFIDPTMLVDPSQPAQPAQVPEQVKNGLVESQNNRPNAKRPKTGPKAPQPTSKSGERRAKKVQQRKKKADKQAENTNKQSKNTEEQSKTTNEPRENTEQPPKTTTSMIDCMLNALTSRPHICTICNGTTNASEAMRKAHQDVVDRVRQGLLVSGITSLDLKV